MNIRELLTKVGFNVEGTEKLKGAEDQLAGIKLRLDALVAVEVIKGMSELAEKFAHFAIELQVAANLAGVTTEQFQKLSLAAGESNVSSQEMSGAMARLARNIYQAKLGSQQASETFRLLGITRDQVVGFKNADDALIAISARMQNIPDQFQKMAISQQLMGRGSKGMVDFLSKGPAAIRATGNEFERLGAVMKGSDVESLTKLEHAMQKAEAVMQAIFGTIAAKLAPIFTVIIDDVLNFAAGFKDFISIDMEGFFEKLAFGLGFIWGFLKGLIVTMSHIVDHLGLTKQGVWEVIEVIGSAVGVLGLIMTIIKAVGIAIGVLSSPITILIALISEIIFVVHDLYALATGGKTWTGQILEWLGHFKLLHATIEGIKDSYEGLVKLAEGVIGFGVETVKSVGNADNSGMMLKELGNIGAGAFQAVKGSAEIAASPLTTAANMMSQSNSNASMNTTINVTVPAGSNGQDIAAHVKAAIEDHHAKVVREVKRGTSTTVGQ